MFVNNRPSELAMNDFSNLESGGAINMFQSNTIFDGLCKFTHNHAGNGGAIHATESKLYVNGNVTTAQNTATGNGGGVYLSNSELNCQQKSTFVLYSNTAAYKRGGLHAISSSIKATYKVEFRLQICYIGTKVHFINNTVKLGGGLSLEANAKLNILKNYDSVDDFNTALFIANSADYGGAVYVDDDTNSGTCASEPKTECFFQVLAVYDYMSLNYNFTTQCMHFEQNYAKISGSNLFGGLLDRCAVSPFAEVYKKYSRIRGIGYFKNV